MSDDTKSKYLRIEISDNGTIEVRGTDEFVDSLHTLIVSGITENVKHRAQRKGVGVKVETEKRPESFKKGSKK